MAPPDAVPSPQEMIAAGEPQLLESTRVVTSCVTLTAVDGSIPSGVPTGQTVREFCPLLTRTEKLSAFHRFGSTRDVVYTRKPKWMVPPSTKFGLPPKPELEIPRN